MRRSPVSVVSSPERDDPLARDAIAGILGGLVSAPELDVSCWCVDRGGSFRRPVHRRDVPPGFGPKDVRWARWEVLSTRPRAVAAALGAALIGGPVAARPSALIAVGLDHAGYVGTALGRVLDIPVAVALLPGDADGGWTEARMRVVRRARGLLAVDARSADLLARRGITAWRPQVAVDGDEKSWAELGEQVARSLVQGAETSTSRS